MQNDRRAAVVGMFFLIMLNQKMVLHLKHDRVLLSITKSNKHSSMLSVELCFFLSAFATFVNIKSDCHLN